MLTDLLLAIAHHLLIFALLAVLVMQIALMKPGLDAALLSRIVRLDMAYGVIAGVIIVVGFARVFFGLKGPEYYLANHFFWAKIAAFVAVGLLSVAPTIRIRGWWAQARARPSFSPSD